MEQWLPAPGGTSKLGLRLSYGQISAFILCSLKPLKPHCVCGREAGLVNVLCVPFCSCLPQVPMVWKQIQGIGLQNAFFKKPNQCSQQYCFQRPFIAIDLSIASFPRPAVVGSSIFRQDHGILAGHRHPPANSMQFHSPASAAVVDDALEGRFNSK